MLIMLILGLSSGLPLVLTGTTLTVWLHEIGVNKTTIGLFAIVTIPYSFKFIWAPIIDFMKIPMLTNLLGRRKSWLITTQFFLIIAIILLAYSDPVTRLTYTALASIFLAFCSATQDIVVDAYRLELLSEKEQGPGVSSYVIGYRIGMLISGAQTLFMAEFFEWSTVYALMAIVISGVMVFVFFIPEPKVNLTSKVNYSIKKVDGIFEIIQKTILAPFADFIQKKNWIALLLLAMLYKLSIAFAGHISQIFYVELGFSKGDIATYVKSYGLIATITGTFIGGALLFKVGLNRALWICGIMQMVSCLMYIVQEYFGYNKLALVFTISIEDLASGMGGAVMLTYLSTLCTNPLFTATQYALISSISSFGRTFISTGSGFVAENLGWTGFFIFSTLLSIPGLIVLGYLNFKGSIKKYKV
ncbi:MAG: MFS transporter [Sphingobacteriia bacterium]|nr:MFS transporter [Sphingobacteriia bacterium]